MCSVDTASQTAPEDSIDVIATPEKGTAITRTSNGHATCDLRDTGGPQPYDIAQKYLQSQQDATELYGSFGWRAGRPNALAQGDELEDFAPEAEHSILSPNATEYCDWSERYSHSDPFGVGCFFVLLRGFRYSNKLCEISFPSTSFTSTCLMPH